MSRLHSCLLSAVCALVLVSLPLRAQETLIHRDGAPPPAVEKVRARMQWMYDRVTYPNGEIPVGARARATQQARESMRLYNPRSGASVQAAAEWRNVGPFNIGGRIIALAVNPKNPRTILIGAADGGIWKSVDGGASWRSVSEDFPTQAMGAIAIDPVDTSIAYAGTGEANFSTSRMFDGGGMFKSTDAGETWVEIGKGSLPAYARASDIVVNPQNHAIVHAAVPDGIRDAAQMGIYTSTDAGATWALSLQGRMSDLVMDPLHPATMYTHSSKVFDGSIAPRYGMFKTTDGGATWSHLNVGPIDSLMGRTSIGICAAHPEVLYIGVSEIVGDGRTWLMGVFKTTDAGATWTKLPVDFDYMVSQGWYDNIIGVHPTNPDIVIAGGVKLVRSSDGGATWTRMRDQGFGGILHVDQHAIEFDPSDPDRVYVGNDGGFYIGTNEGSVWTKSDLGLSITQFVGGAMHPTRDDFLLGGTQDNGTLASAAPPMWSQVLYGDGGNGAINPDQPNIMFSTKETLKFWRSDDYGRSWVEAMGGLPAEGSLFYIDYAMDLRKPSTLYLGTYRLYKTTNDGRTWRTLSSCPFQSSGGGCYYITAVSVAPYSSDIVLAAAPGQVGISTDAGATWRISQGVLPLAYCSSVHSFTPGNLYATFSRYGVGKVWKSTDLGVTWVDISGNLPDIPTNDIIELDGKLIIGTDVGCFISENGGVEWQRFGSGLPALSVQKLRYNARTGTLRAMTHARGMYDLAWKQPATAAPVFVSTPPAAVLSPGQPYMYAPVVDATPPATFSIDTKPMNVTVDGTLGTIQWTAVAGANLSVTLRARNSAGETTQTVPLQASSASSADWKIVKSYPAESAVKSMRLASDGSLWVVQDSAIVNRGSTADFQAWTLSTLPGGKAAVLCVHPFDAMHAVIGTASGRLATTTDGGATWTAPLAKPAARFSNLHFWNQNEGIAVSIGALDSLDVFFTSDGGVTWTQSADPRPYARAPIDNTLTFFDRSNGWFASSNDGKSPMEDASVLRTTDGGRTWIPKSTGTRSITSLAFLNPLRGFAVDEVQGRVRRTVSGGQAWSTTFYPMNGLRNVTVQVEKGTGAVWIVSDTSAWVSRDEGGSWTRTQLVPAGPMETAIFPDSAHGWAITQRGIIEELVGNPLTSVAAAPAPAATRVDAVWPNPVTANDDATSVSFTLAASAHVSLRVFNSAGKEVAVMADTDLPAGEHMSVWNPGAISSGTYFVTLEAAGQRSVARVIVAR